MGRCGTEVVTRRSRLGSAENVVIVQMDSLVQVGGGRERDDAGVDVSGSVGHRPQDQLHLGGHLPKVHPVKINRFQVGLKFRRRLMKVEIVWDWSHTVSSSHIPLAFDPISCGHFK